MVATYPGDALVHELLDDDPAPCCGNLAEFIELELGIWPWPVVLTLA